ncbi:hypothetical protein M8J77_018233 [Diaphorina citri]|nr:hypothetical protein M8J77_018233 [Diaphorina citri]
MCGEFHVKNLAGELHQKTDELVGKFYGELKSVANNMTNINNINSWQEQEQQHLGRTTTTAGKNKNKKENNNDNNNNNNQATIIPSILP